MHLICQMRCRLGALKRGVLSRTFVWKLRIAVNFFTPIAESIAEALTASESERFDLFRSHRQRQLQAKPVNEMRQGVGQQTEGIGSEMMATESIRTFFEFLKAILKTV
jgi:hypothetical protein